MTTLRTGLRLLFRPVHLLVAVLACVVVPSAVVVKQLSDNVGVQPIDELAHWDYVQRLATGELPHLGDPYQPATNREGQCRGALVAGTPPPPGCDRNLPAADYFPAVPVQYEAHHPPGTYLLILPIRWVGMEVFGLSDFAASRLSGVVFLVMGLCLLWLVGRLVEIPPWVLASGILLLGCSPAPVYMSSYVTNDSTAVLAGSLAALAGVVAWRRPGRASAVAAVVVGAGIAMLKVSNLLAVLAVSVTYTLVSWRAATDDSKRRTRDALGRWAGGGGALLGGAIGVAVLWTLVSRSMDVVDPRQLGVLDGLRSTPVDYWRIIRSGTALVNPFSGAETYPGRLGTDAQALRSTLTLLVVGGGAVSGLFVGHRRWHHWLGLTSIGSALVGGAVLGLGLHLTFAIDPLLQTRYGLSLAPLLILATVAGLRGRVAQAAVGIVSVVVALTALTAFYL